jgi:hypothetical protein
MSPSPVKRARDSRNSQGARPQWPVVQRMQPKPSSPYEDLAAVLAVLAVLQNSLCDLEREVANLQGVVRDAMKDGAR